LTPLGQLCGWNMPYLYLFGSAKRCVGCKG
jgi:hypothetical protein